MRARILVVDDETSMQRILQILLQDLGHEATCVGDGAAALERLERDNFDLVISDMRMPRMDGLGLLREMRSRGLETPVIMITAHGTVESAVEAMKLGAVDYLLRPFDVQAAELAVTRALGVAQVRRENRFLRAELEQGWDEFIGSSRLMRDLYASIDAFAPNRAPVFITGETGTGKELVARALHRRSGRQGLFVPVNCAAIPASMLESEMFGHVKGAYTGAERERAGKFVAADGGTLFLDEIGEMQPELQARLLRVVQEGVVEPLGANRRVEVDVRIVAATNRDPRRAVSEGRLREDLLFRLNVLRVDIPPLRERREDIPLLLEYFLTRHGRLLGRTPPTLDDTTLRVLCDYAWPGNVRELQNIAERALVLGADGGMLRRMVQDAAPVPETATHERGTDGAVSSGQLPERVAELERDMIRAALAASGDNKARAARQLGISERSLWYRLKRYGL